MVNITVDYENRDNPAFTGNVVYQNDAFSFSGDEEEPITQMYRDAKYADSQLGGIADACVQVEVLEEISNILESQETVDPQAVKIANIVLENISRNLKLPLKAIAVESYGDKTAVMESVGGVIKTIWQAILDTFKAVWDVITSFFRTRREDEAVLKMKKFSEKYKGRTIRYKSKGPVFESPLLYRLNFKGEGISVFALKERAERVSDELKKMIEIIKASNEYSKDTISAIKKFMDNEVGDEALETYTTVGVDALTEYQKNVFNLGHSHTKLDRNDYRDSLLEFGESKGVNNVLSQPFTYVKCFYNEAIVASVKVPGNDGVYISSIVTVNQEKNKVTMKSPTHEELSDLFEALDNTHGEIYKTSQKMAGVLKEASGEDSITVLLPKLLSFVEKNYSNASTKVILPLRELVAQLRDEVRAATYIGRTEKDFNRLLEELDRFYVIEPTN